jgi:hypothetical protein
MSLGYELVVFDKFIMFIKFIRAWQIRNRASPGCQRSNPIAALGGWTEPVWQIGPVFACYHEMRWHCKQNKGLSWISFEISGCDSEHSIHAA